MSKKRSRANKHPRSSQKGLGSERAARVMERYKRRGPLTSAVFVEVVRETPTEQEERPKLQAIWLLLSEDPEKGYVITRHSTVLDAVHQRDGIELFSSGSLLRTGRYLDQEKYLEHTDLEWNQKVHIGHKPSELREQYEFLTEKDSTEEAQQVTP